MKANLDTITERVAEYGKQVDFGKTASDYGRYRAGYPDGLYRRLERLGVGVAGQRHRDFFDHGVAAGDADPSAEGGEADRSGLADSSGAAGDQDDLAGHGECVRHGPPLRW